MKKIFLMFLLVLIAFLLVSCSEKINKKSYTFFAMDTFISITFYNVEDSKDIADKVQDIYYTYDKYASDYSTGSNEMSVYDLNELREGNVTEELKAMLEFALEMQVKTNGYYNPLIGRLSHLWKDALNDMTLVADEVVTNELVIMNESKLIIEKNYVKIEGEANIDLGGIAKGFATNKAKEYLESINCTSFLLNAGSSNIVLGDKNGEEFTVGLSKALDDGYFYTLSAKDTAISTSSIKEQHVLIDDKYYSHLLNPKTGYPAMYYDSISILGPNSGILDAYTTACFCMELEEVEEFLLAEGLDYIISKDNVLLTKSAEV